MGNDNALRLVLRSLCQNTHWNYAVFWKLDGWNQMQLYWEDAYFDNAKSSISMRNGYFSGNSGFLSFGEDAKNTKYSECSIRSAVTNMSSRTYILGEGILGNVASKNKHQWICAGQYSSKLLQQCHADYQLQFAAGIKTVLLVPVIPLGVVQLGSSHMVTEDPMTVAQITDMFSILRDTEEKFDLYESINIPAIENLWESSSLSNLVHTIHSPTSAKEELPDFDLHQLPKNISSISLSEDFLDMSFYTEGISQMATCRDLLIDSTLPSAYPEQIFDVGSLLTPRFVDGLNEFSGIDNIFTTTEPIIPNFYIDDQEHYYVEGMSKRCFNFPLQSELQKTIGFESVDEYDDHIWNAIMSKTDEHNNSICQTEVENTGYFIEKGDTEQLLDGIISNLNYAFDNDVSGISRWIKSPSNSSANYPNSSLRHFKIDDHILGFEELVPSRHQTHVHLPNSSVSCLTNEEQHTGNMTAICDKMDSKSSQRSKRRDRNMDSRRPRDRQLIQDRLRELRELIPDGSKCSIDVLLERTVKHMSYLQSIPERAEKLRQSTYRNIKVDGEQPQVCPLIVENLDQPGQMLVEMLCKEYGLFLEIVQVIKCLKLTILKGILESRSNELWAHFIVEGARGFYRMDILLPLMQLLQRN